MGFATIWLMAVIHWILYVKKSKDDNINNEMGANLGFCVSESSGNFWAPKTGLLLFASG